MPTEQIAYLAMMVVGAFGFVYCLRDVCNRSIEPVERIQVKAHSRDETFSAWWDDYGHQLDVSYYIAEEIWAAAVEAKK